MPKTKKVKAAGRFGARYGRRVRTKIAEIETTQRKKQDCIFCNGTGLCSPRPFVYEDGCCDDGENATNS